MVPISPVYLVPLGFVVFSSPFVAIGLISQRKSVAVGRWPRVKGRIIWSGQRTTTSQTRDPVDPNWAPNAPNDQRQTFTQTYYSADARYTYEVDGKKHEGQTISREGISSGLKNVQEWLGRHPPGTEVNVYVDPRDPANAYLEWKRWTTGVIFLLACGGVLMFIGVLIFVIFLLVGGS